MALVGELLSALPLLTPPSLKPSSSSSLRMSDSFRAEGEQACEVDPAFSDQSSCTGRMCSSGEAEDGGAPDKLYVPLLRLPSSESRPSLGYPVCPERSASGCLDNQAAREEPGHRCAEVCYHWTEMPGAITHLIRATSLISPSLAENGRVPHKGVKRSLHPLSSVPMFLLTFSLRMERMTLTMLTLVSGTLHRIKQRRRSNMRTRGN